MQMEVTGRLTWIANTQNANESVTIRARDDDGGQIDQTVPSTLKIGDQIISDIRGARRITPGTISTRAEPMLYHEEIIVSGQQYPLVLHFGTTVPDTQTPMSTNGFITFLSGQSHGCCSGRRLPNTGTPNAVIAGYWENLIIVRAAR